MLLEDLDRHVLAERQVAAVMIAAGAKGDLPTAQAARETFDAALVSEPSASYLSTDEDELRRVLGV